MTESSSWIAIVGMAGRFPGARNLAEFWRNLRDGIESISTLSEQQLRAGVRPSEIEYPTYVRSAAILEDFDRFDAAFFGFSPKDAAVMDPQHRLFLECAWEALENAAWCPEEFSGRIGVYASSGMNSYLIYNLLTNPELVREAGLFLLKQTGNDKDVLATRVSYQLNLTGPSLAVQTACSSSLVAVHVACQSLLNHECDMALAGGVTIDLPHGRDYNYQGGEFFSHDGHCRAFDAKSSGTVSGSGLGIVTLRRFDDAVRTGDPIRAVIRGTAINNDGARKVGYLAPSGAGQVEVIREALAVAQIDARSILYVETNGTGTRVGDPVEVQALTEAYRESTDDTEFCAIGSVKTNIGQLDAAAGVAGLIKTVLALEHRQIPASLNYTQPNPLIDFAHSPFFVNSALREWRTGTVPRRAAVTSLGIGGTNAHVILEEAPERAGAQKTRSWQLLTLSAKTPAALATIARNLAKHFADHPVELAEVAQTLHFGRTPLPLRQTLVCRDSSEAAIALGQLDLANLAKPAIPADPPVIFMFPGQGAQYPGMGRELYHSEATFRTVVESCAEFLRPHLGVDLREVMFPHDQSAQEAERLLNQTRFTQPALFVIEYALAQLWLSWGIEPSAMIGHGVGEFSAACMAGVMRLESALRIVAEQGRLMQALSGGAVTVWLPEHELAPLLIDGLAIAAVNTEDQCVVTGPEDRLCEFESRLAAKNPSLHRLRVSHTLHSAMMEPILGPFREFLRGFSFAPPQIRYISSATGIWVTPEQATDPAYWAHQLRATVRFADGMAHLLDVPDAIFLEVGPSNTLIALAEQHSGRAAGHRFVPSMRRRDETVSDVAVLLEGVGKLWTTDKRIDWQGFHAGEARRRVELPSYPFERKRYWIDPGRTLAVATAPVAESPQAHSRLGFYRPVWRRAEPDSTGRENCEPWLIFQDELGLGATLAEALRRRGEECVVVTAGHRFERLQTDQFEIDPGNRTDYELLFYELSAQSRPPRTIVHLWSVVTGGWLGEPLDSLAGTENASFSSLVYLAQALAELNPAAAIEMGIVSNCLQNVSGEAIFRPERALLFGPCNVIPKELLNVRCRAIDFTLAGPGSPQNGELSGALREAASLLANELRSSSDDTAVAFRSGRRWVRDFSIVDEQDSDPPLVPAEQGVYVITGGLDAIGLEFAVWLARSAHARLVLVERGLFPAREEWPGWMRDHDDQDPVAEKIRKVRAVEEAGGEVVIASVDITDLRALQKLVCGVRARLGTIDGVIHAAGVLEDAPLSQKKADAAARVLAPKVRGTLTLVAALADKPPKLLVLMSSVSAVLGPAGQIDYTAANAFLDSFAQARSPLMGCRTIAIQWPRWRDIGIAHPDTPTLDSAADATYPDSISAAEAVGVLGELLNYGESANVTVFPSDFVTAFRKSQPAASMGPAEAATTKVAPRDDVERTLADWWKSLLGLESVTIRDDFFELGGQSLAALRLLAFIRKTYKIELGLPALFSASTIEKLGRLVRGEEKPPPYSAVIAIQPNGQRAPLILIPGMGNALTSYEDLLRRLRPDQPIYGLQLPPDDSREVRTLEAIATHYLKEIRGVQPRGPYNLLGHSFGGVLAFEIAQQLHAQRESVGFLGMLDTVELGYLKGAKKRKNRLTEIRRHAQIISSVLSLAIFGPSRLRRLKDAFATAHQSFFALWMTNVVYCMFTLRNKPLPRFIRKDLYLNQLALNLYVPKVYPGCITLFRAEHRFSSAVLHSAQLLNSTRITEQQFDADIGWLELASAGVEIHQVPGDHFDLMREPNVRVLADELTACLERSYKRTWVAPTNVLDPMRTVRNFGPEIRVS